MYKVFANTEGKFKGKKLEQALQDSANREIEKQKAREMYEKTWLDYFSTKEGQNDTLKLEQIVKPFFSPNGKYIVFHNGAPIGLTDRIEIVETIRQARRVRTISSDVCVAIENDNIEIWTDKLFRLYQTAWKKLLTYYSKSHIKTFFDPPLRAKLNKTSRK